MINTVLFDLDGVIADTGGLHFKIDQQVLKENGRGMSIEGIRAAHSGIKDGEFFKSIFIPGKTLEQVKRIEGEKWRIAESVPREQIIPMPGIYELLNYLHKINMKLGIVSSSTKRFIDLVISSLNIKEMFRTVVCGNDVNALKPSPEGLLLAAKLLASEPQDCLFIDDGINGMVAAKAAKMHAIGFVRKRRQISYPADIIVGSLYDITPALLASL